MAKIKLIKEPSDSYFKKITLYEFEIESERVIVNCIRSSIRSEITYWDFLRKCWSIDAPNVVNRLGRNDEGNLIIEDWLTDQNQMNLTECGEYII